MPIRIGVFEGTEMRPSYLPMLAMAGLGIAMAVYSFNFVNRKLYVSLGRKIKLSRIEDDGDDGEITMAEDSVDVNGGMSPIIEFDCLRTLDELKYTRKKHNDRVDRLRFLLAVDRSLHLYPCPKLKTFSLTCCFLEEYLSHFKRWMQTIARLDVEELILSSLCGNMTTAFTFRFQLISGLYTLRKLHLSFCNIEPGLVGQFKSLVSLSFMFVKLARNELSDILPSCPNLQYLLLDVCELPMKTRISGPNLKLKALTLLHCSGLHELEISAVDLVHISIDSPIRLKLLLSFVPKLEHLSLVTNRPTPYCFYGGDVRWDLPKLTTLVLKAIFQWNEIPWLPPRFDMFGNVRLLYLVMARDYYHLEDCPQADLFSLSPVLSACPLLETFHLMVDGCNSNEERGVEWPVLRHKHLKHMEIAGFSNTQNELEFARFIMRSAEVLQKLVLRASLIYCDGLGVCDFPENEPRSDINEIEAQMITRDLRDHALSVEATVEIR